MRKSQELDRAVRFFTRESGIMDGLCVIAGRGNDLIGALDGREIGPETVYDLASVTKIFTGLCLMRLREMGLLALDAPVTAYDPRFSGMRGVTVAQLMAFQVPVQTAGRVDAARDREEALECLLKSAVVSPEDSRIRRFYSDIPAMILKYVIERAAGVPFYPCLQQLILEPAEMHETWALVPEARRGDCLLYGPEYRIEKEKWICRKDPARGIPHDPKAARLQGDTADLCGHAGLFSTAGDLIRLCRAVLDGKILSPASLSEMAVNRTGRKYPDGSFSQYLGYLCYVKHPDQYYSEIPERMSPAAFGIGGFTGNHLSIDPRTGQFTVFLGNRVRDRLTVLLPETGKTIGDYGLNADGTGILRWTDGSAHFSSVNYVHQKDRRLHSVIDSELGLA